MANTSRIRGLLPLHAGAGEMRTNTRGGKYTVKAASTIYAGDLVRMVSAASGTVEQAPEGAGDDAIGVAAHSVFSDDSDRDLLVHDNPDTIFEIECDGAISASDVGKMADIAPGSGRTIVGTYDPKRANRRGISGAFLKYSTIGTGSAQAKVLGLVDRPGNEWGAYAKVKVVLIEHQYRTAATFT